MFNSDATALIASVQNKRAMTDADLLALRRAFGADLELSTHEADTLFLLNTLPALPEAWQDYFVNTIAYYVVDATEPRSHLHESNAAWLMARIDHDGVVETDTELALVLTVLKRARSVPERFATYALAQIREAVLNGRGVVGTRVLTPGVIGQAEVELLRTLLYAAGGTDGVGVSRCEAEMLMDLNDATDGADNAPEWTFLFSRAVANYLMVLRPPAAPSAAEVLRRQEWFESKSRDKRSLGALVREGFAEVFGRKDEAPRSYILDEAGRADAARVTSEEAGWLIDRLNRDGVINGNERELLAFLRDECPEIHASLKPLLKAA